MSKEPADPLIEHLNRCCDLDKEAMTALVANKVPCNERLARFLLYDMPPGAPAEVGLLSILNGMRPGPIVMKVPPYEAPGYRFERLEPGSQFGPPAGWAWKGGAQKGPEELPIEATEREPPQSDPLARIADRLDGLTYLLEQLVNLKVGEMKPGAIRYGDDLATSTGGEPGRKLRIRAEAEAELRKRESASKEGGEG